MQSDSIQDVLLPADAGDRPRRIGCPGCRRPLPLRLSRDGEQAALWECDSCRTRIAGMFMPELAPHMAHRVRLGQVHFDTRRSQPIPPVLGDLVSKWAPRTDKNEHGPERRRDDRFKVRHEAAVVCLNEQWMPQGQPVRVLAVDLSRGGLGMIAASTIQAPLVAIQMQGRTGTVQLLAKVVWSDQVDGDSGFHHIGVQFVHRLGRNV
jgi:hypothetical protein